MTEEVNPIEEMQKNVAELRATEDIIEEVHQADEDGDEGTPEYTDIELKAMERGWNPDKDNLPEGKEWIGAGEFMRNEKLYDEIHKLKREIKARGRDFEVLKEHHKKVADAEREKLLTQLKHQKKIALEDDDHDAVIEIDEQIMDVKAAKAEPDEIDTQNNDNSAFLDWVEDNSWYEKDDDMRQTADEIGAAYMQRTGGKAAPEDLFKYVEGRIKKLYPAEFETKPNPRKTKTPTVESGTRGRKAAAKAPQYTVKDLNAEQLKVMRQFEKTGVLTADEYIDELVRIGELG